MNTKHLSALLTALLLASCGGGGDESTTGFSTAPSDELSLNSPAQDSGTGTSDASQGGSDQSGDNLGTNPVSPPDGSADSGGEASPGSPPSEPPQVDAQPQPTTFCPLHNPFGVPTGGTTLCRSGYSVGHSSLTKQPIWASYFLTAALVNEQIARTDDFREDTDLPVAERSTLADYKGSGYDRGHLAPAASVGFDRQSMSESFLLSNMSPQLPAFNRGGWADLEDAVRECVNKVGDLLVVSGPVFQSPFADRINGTGPSVADRFFKLIVKLSAPRQAFAVSIEHNSFDVADLGGFVVTTDELERQTGIDFLSGLDDSEENPLEASSVDFCGMVQAPQAPTAPTDPVAPAPSPFGPCGTKTTCSQMTSCSEANYYYRSCNVSRLDGDKDGVPCESLCR